METPLQKFKAKQKDFEVSKITYYFMIFYKTERTWANNSKQIKDNTESKLNTKDHLIWKLHGQ